MFPDCSSKLQVAVCVFMASQMVLVICGVWLWNDLIVVLGTIASVVSQIKSTTDSMNPLMSLVTSTVVSWNVLPLRHVVLTVGRPLIGLTIS